MRKVRKKLFRSVAIHLLPPLGSWLIRLLYALNRKTFHLPETIPDEPIIFACWHGNLLMQPMLYRQIRKTPHAKVMISSHFDGILIAKTVKYLGLASIHDDKNSPARLALQALRALKEGYDIGITPDGPKGPRHEASEGIVMLAQKMKAPIMFFHCCPTRYWQVNSWDRFVVPKPFGRLEFFASEPIRLEGLSLEAAKAAVQAGLMRHAF